MKSLMIVLVIGLTVSGCQLVLPSGALHPPATSTPQFPALSKQITSNTLPLVERWRWSDNINNLSISRPAVAVTEDQVIILKREDAEQRVMVFDIHTGDYVWESEDIANIRSVATDDERVYIGTITYVQAFDLETGQELWRGAEQPSMKKGGFVVYAKEDQVEAYDISEPVVYILDPITGQTIDEIPKLLFFRWNGVDYSIVRGEHLLLEARNAMNNEKLWSNAFPGYIGGRPVFSGDTMLLTSRGQIFGVKAKTGEIIWQTANPETTFTHPVYITGVALQDDLAYALRYDAAIVGFNPDTGEQIGIVEMMPGHTLEDDKGEVKHYTIVTSDKYVVVYYGNSQELIVFERVNGGE